MKNLIKYLSALDWLVSSLTIIYGLVVGPIWLVPMGVLSMGIAWFKPAVYIEKKIAAKFLKKKTDKGTEPDKATEDFYASMLGTSQDIVPATEQENTDSFKRTVALGKLHLGTSKHNLLKQPNLNLFQVPEALRKF